MALINGIYVQVTNEQVETGIELSEYSVESGADRTDHSKPKLTTLSLEGKIVDYSGYSSVEREEESSNIKAWISLVKKDGSPFDSMSFSKLNNELLYFSEGCRFVNTGSIQYLSGDELVDEKNGTGVTQVKFEVVMSNGSMARIQNTYKQYCCFNIINKSTTGYAVQDYNADEDISDSVLSNTYNGERGRVRTEFINNDTPYINPAPDINKKAAWVLEQLRILQKSAALIKYEGRNLIDNLQIETLSTSHTSGIAGGAEFSMTLKQCRTADNSFWYGDRNGGLQQISTGDNTEIWYDVQLGDSVHALVEADNAPYKNLTRGDIDGISYNGVEWVLKKNPSAFEDPSDVSTLRAYEKILLGTR